MASTTDSTMASDDELVLEVVRSQIICMYPHHPRTGEPSTDNMADNLRILKPSMSDPTITTAYDRSAKSWRAAIWNDGDKVIFSTHEGTDTVLAAMRKLLLLPSTIVHIKMEQWEARDKSGAFHTSGGVMYT
jgi:hypothetical protein